MANEAAKQEPGSDGVEVRVSLRVDSGLIDRFPLELAEKHGVVPLAVAGNHVFVAAARSLGPAELEALSQDVGLRVHAVPAEIEDLERLLHQMADRRAHLPRLGELLKADSVITQDELERALDRQADEPRPLGQILVDLGYVSLEELDWSLKRQSEEGRVPVDPSLFVDVDTLLAIPESLARRHGVLPLARTADTLVIGTGQELDRATIREIESVVGTEVDVLHVDAEELAAAMEQCYTRQHRLEVGQLRIGEILIKRGLITQQQLDEALEAQKSGDQKLGEILVERGYVSEDALYASLAEKLGVQFRRVSPSRLDPELSELIPRRFAERNLVMPVAVDRDAGVLEVAMVNPNDLKVRDMVDRVARERGLESKIVLATSSDISHAIAFTHQSQSVTDDAVELETVEDEELDSPRDDLIYRADMPAIRKLVNQTLYRAIVEGASDIHIESLDDEVRVRFRVDGILEERDTAITPDNIPKVISVLKLDAGLDIAERRRSQDGVFKKRIGKEHVIDFRINVHATKFGEDAVIRILDPTRNLMKLEDLGFTDAVLERYRTVVENPQGMILFTGPTGSGKTTTLYSTLMHLNRGDKKIVTAEDPVEYNLRGISQYQVNPAIGGTFAEYARRFLRKDPDIILIGEIRDAETADSCISAAMTGHLVFSTLHTNDALGVVQRLRELDVEHSAIADGLLAVVSQRLARRVCSRCEEPYRPDRDLVLEFFEAELPPDVELQRGTGCEACNGKGFKGRVGLYEYWEIGREARNAIAHSAGEDEIKAIAHSEGFVPLMADALRKVGEGLTTLEELRRVVPLEQIRAFAKA